MKRSGDDLEDASDRACKLQKVGQVRIPLEQIGFLPGNRCGMGICPRHTHEVAWDGMANKTKLTRYKQVDVVQIPPHRRCQILDVNRIAAASSSLMPKFSPEIKYVA